MNADLQERVSQICNDLYGKGEKISVRAVLSLLPDVSSTSTMHKYVKAWRDELQANQQSLMERLGFSEKFTQSFLEEFSRFNTEAEKRWREAAEQAREQAREAIEDLERIEKKYDKQQALLEQSKKTINQLEEQSRENNKTHQRIETELRDRIVQLDKDKSNLAETNEALRTEIAKSQLKLENNETYVTEVKENQRRVTQELQIANQKISEQAATIAKLETNTERDAKQIEDLRNSTVDYRRLMEESEKRAGKLEDKIRELETQLTTVRKGSEDKISALKIDNEKLAKDNADKERRLVQQDKVIDKLTNQTE
ncbi:MULTISPECIES: DNA-binding protein [Pseudoalteromonas]|uniref:DNA-binding protein n=1 Tax=Pseudoalteromonas TaxID=53246 RepID=UPI0015817E75|nr:MULTISPECIES: DNA-binding protein [Pseudoalteromonas]MDI4653633.1 DNA-binding protein [Pseudoalteromonas shioyasakiensis]NUJ39332.1 DNA-binding protein [Pseudoalteromonas sp. 0303]